MSLDLGWNLLRPWQTCWFIHDSAWPKQGCGNSEVHRVVACRKCSEVPRPVPPFGLMSLPCTWQKSNATPKIMRSMHFSGACRTAKAGCRQEQQ